MIKIHANVSKKVPVPNLDFSSQSYMAGIEVEISDGATDEQIRDRLAHVYSMLEASVDREIVQAEAKARTPVVPTPPGPSSRPNSSTAPTVAPQSQQQPPAAVRKASQAQVKAIFAIGKSLGLSREAVLLKVSAECGVSEPESLSMSQASELIQRMKGPAGQK